MAISGDGDLLSVIHESIQAEDCTGQWMHYLVQFYSMLPHPTVMFFAITHTLTCCSFLSCLHFYAWYAVWAYITAYLDRSNNNISSPSCEGTYSICFQIQ